MAVKGEAIPTLSLFWDFFGDFGGVQRTSEETARVTGWKRSGTKLLAPIWAQDAVAPAAASFARAVMGVANVVTGCCVIGVGGAGP